MKILLLFIIQALVEHQDFTLINFIPLPIVCLHCYVYLRADTHIQMTGVSLGLECSNGVFGQQGHVELEVRNLVKELFRTAIVCQSMEQ